MYGFCVQLYNTQNMFYCLEEISFQVRISRSISYEIVGKTEKIIALRVNYCFYFRFFFFIGERILLQVLNSIHKTGKKVSFDFDNGLLPARQVFFQIYFLLTENVALSHTLFSLVTGVHIIHEEKKQEFFLFDTGIFPILSQGF